MGWLDGQQRKVQPFHFYLINPTINVAMAHHVYLPAMGAEHLLLPGKMSTRYLWGLAGYVRHAVNSRGAASKAEEQQGDTNTTIAPLTGSRIQQNGG